MNTNTDTSRRPSLYSCSSSSSEQTETFSLLDAGERSRGGILRGHRLAFLLLALTLLAMGMALVRLGAPRIPPWVGETPSAPRQAMQPSAVPAVSPQATADDSASEVSLAGAASIVSEAEREVDAAAPVPAVISAAAATAGAAATPAIASPATTPTGNALPLAALPAAGNSGGDSRQVIAGEGTQGAKLVPPAVPSKKAASTQDASGAATPAARPTPRHTTRPTHATRAYRKPGHGKRSHKEDSDVDLIAALLSRVSHGDKAAASPVRRTTGKVANAPAKDQVDDPNRDIVVPGEGESLAHLVQRCRALGVVEGELCRIRICSGKWGKDPACPVSPGAPSN